MGRRARRRAGRAASVPGLGAMTWLVTGGAGYIGATVVAALTEAGRDVVVLDDLSTGDPSRVPEGVELVRASVLDQEAVRHALAAHDVDGVVHVAAKKR